jgi:4-coumarate--CoA ligase
MPIQSRWSMPIPSISLPTYVFGSSNGPLPDRLALIDANKPDTHFFTLSSYRLWAKRVAVGLQKAGLQPGDRVLLFSGNSIFFPVLFMGVLMAGGIFTGANPSYVARELAHQLRDSDAKFLVTASGSLEVALEAAGTIGLGKNRMFIFDDEPYEGRGSDLVEVRHWKALIGSVREGENFEWTEPLSPKDTTACLNYSSGTTGVPKGVEITHTNYVANASQSRFLTEFSRDSGKNPNDQKWLCFLPMYHAMAQTIFIMSGPSRGIQVYIMPKFDFLQMLENLQKFKITELIAVPPIIIALAKSPVVNNFDLSHIHSVLSGAAPLGREISKELEDRWKAGDVNLKQGWGMTEATCTVLSWDPRKWSNSAAVGELVPNCEAKIMNDEETAEVPRGERGEIWVRGPNIMKGYWRNEKATKETLTPEGWMKTGDICYVDEDNYFFIVDRKKELIKVKGSQVAPAELEAILLEHPDVADAAVVGVSISGEELPRAYVVLIQGGKATEDDIARFMDGKVSRNKRLTGGVKFVEIIPKNPVSQTATELPTSVDAFIVRQDSSKAVTGAGQEGGGRWRYQDVQIMKTFFRQLSQPGSVARFFWEV